MHLPRPRPGCLVFPCLALAGFFVTGCAVSPPPVHSMRDAQADFATFDTFSWDAEKDTAQPISILDGEIRAAISSELQRKGYTEAGAGTRPDLTLQYETAAAEVTKSKPFRIGVGVGGYGNSGGAGVGVSSAPTDNVREGTLVLRVIDPERNAEVWNGRVSREVSKSGPPDAELIQAAVRELLLEFPSRAGELKQSGQD